MAGTFGSCSRAVRKSDGLEVAIKSILKSNRRFKVETILHEAEVRVRGAHEFGAFSGPTSHHGANCFLLLHASSLSTLSFCLLKEISNADNLGPFSVFSDAEGGKPS